MVEGMCFKQAAWMSKVFSFACCIISAIVFINLVKDSSNASCPRPPFNLKTAFIYLRRISPNNERDNVHSLRTKKSRTGEYPWQLTYPIILTSLIQLVNQINQDQVTNAKYVNPRMWAALVTIFVISHSLMNCSTSSPTAPTVPNLKKVTSARSAMR